MPIATVNPTTGETLKTFQSLTPAEVEVKLKAAEGTFRTFRRVSFAERGRMMAAAAEILESEKETCARLMTTEMGKTFRSAVDEAAKCATACRYYAEHAEQFLADP